MMMRRIQIAERKQIEIIDVTKIDIKSGVITVKYSRKVNCKLIAITFQ